MADSESKLPRKIVLLGKTGEGKSSSGNTILNERRFTTESSPESTTARSQSEVATVNGRRVTVIDTPGIFDTCRDETVFRSEIIGSIIECAPTVDAFVIVLKVQRYTQHEREFLDKIVEYYGEETFKHAVVLFTHGEELEGQTIEGFVKKSPKLQELVNKCGGRCHVLDNKHWNDRHVLDNKHWNDRHVLDNKHWNDRHVDKKSNKDQVNNLMNTIDKMAQRNGCFTNELISCVDKEIQEEMNRMDTIHLCPEEKREAAKKNVCKIILIRLAGVSTGILIGAFLGIGVAVGSVVALLKFKAKKDIFKEIVTIVTAAGKVARVAAGATVAESIAVEAGIVTGTAAEVTAQSIAVEAGAAASVGIRPAAGSGIAVGVIFGAAALAGAVRGGITGYKAAEDADSVLDAIKLSAKTNYENAKEVVQKAEQLSSNVYKKLQ